VRIAICGHASLLVETFDQTILIDPVLTAGLLDDTVVFYPQRQFFLERLPRLTLLVITHGHFDHFHPESLASISRDLMVVAPGDPELIERLHAVGFHRISQLEPWQAMAVGKTSLTATSSSHEEPEFGLIIRDASAAFWHMADGEVEPEDGHRALDAANGRIDVVACKYQPVVNASMSYLRGSGSGFAARDVCDWLEAACLTQPRFIFPYASGLCFSGEHIWFNRYAFPLTQDEAVALLKRRLGSGVPAGAVFPGDVIEADRQAVRYRPQSAGFVAHQPTTAPQHWEPVDCATLVGLPGPADRKNLDRLLRAFLARSLAPWLRAALQNPSGMWPDFVGWGVVWQLAVHLGESERLIFAIDFRDAAQIRLTEGAHADANFFTHLSGKALLGVLRGERDGIIFWLAGAARSYEKIIGVKDGHFWFPELPAMAHLRPSDPLTFLLRHHWDRDQARHLLRDMGLDE